MKNSTKIRLHLSKTLFESLTKQVLKEGKSNMGGGAYTQAVKAPKAGKPSKMDEMSSKKKMEKGLYKEDQGSVGEKEVTITLDEIVTSGGEGLADIGYWALKAIPGIAKALSDSGINDPYEQAHNIGGSLVGLATAGTVGVSLGLGMYAEKIKNAGQKIKDAAEQGVGALKKLIGKKDNMSEGDMGGDESLEAIVAQIAGH